MAGDRDPTADPLGDRHPTTDSLGDRHPTTDPPGDRHPTTDPLDDFDLFAGTAAGDVRDPYPDYAKARVDTPVDRTEFFGDVYYRVFRYADVGTVLRDPATFSSSIYGEFMEPVLGVTILQMDGAEHHVHRGLVASAFRRKALESWQATLIEPEVHRLIDELEPRGEADLVRDFAFRFPIRVISGILGIPPGDEERFARLSIEMISIAVDVERGLAASKALQRYFAGLVDERRREPRDDLISALATAEVDGRRLDDEHIRGFLHLLLPAGAETTYRLIGSLLFALLQDPPLLEGVRQNRALISRAIEETLRWEAPVQFVSRRPTRDVEIAGVEIPAGSRISCVLGAANRDDSVYERPDEFDLDRPGPPPHLAFADGPHRCLGEHLARLETTIAVGALLDRLPGLRLEPGDRDPHVHGEAFRSPTCLPVRFG